ncbi:MAG TPA: DUF2505 family protein [Myxococcota bacterium]|nr:DUF2505 family protein [Myxococcota bacterium]
MKFKYEHDFPTDRNSLISAIFDNGVTERLKAHMSTVMDAQTLEWTRDGDRIRRRVRYLPVPMINDVGGKKVEPQWMEWVEESEVDLAAGRAEFRNVPTTSGIVPLLENTGVMEFVELDGGHTRRIITGELRVKVFLVGRIAELIIADTARKILDDEAAAMRILLQAGTAS